jgi:hypothetical protein
MRHELNTPEEMLKRLVYVVYVGVLFFGFLYGIMGIFAMQLDAVITAAGLVLSAYLLRRFGVRHCDFPRLKESFPMGAPQDRISRATRNRLESLIEAFHKEQTWVRRQEIRDTLTRLVREEPLLLETFKKEIVAVHPALYYDSSINPNP